MCTLYRKFPFVFFYFNPFFFSISLPPHSFSSPITFVYNRPVRIFHQHLCPNSAWYYFMKPERKKKKTILLPCLDPSVSRICLSVRMEWVVFIWRPWIVSTEKKEWKPLVFSSMFNLLDFKRSVSDRHVEGRRFDRFVFYPTYLRWVACLCSFISWLNFWKFTKLYGPFKYSKANQSRKRSSLFVTLCLLFLFVLLNCFFFVLHWLKHDWHCLLWILSLSTTRNSPPP